MILTALSDKSGGGQETVRTRLVGRHNSWFVPGLYVTELRRTWSMGLLFAIVLFFALPVMNLLVFTNDITYYEKYPEQVQNYLEGFFSDANPFITVFACLGGMLCAMVVTEYLFDRRKTNFVCSLPVTRQAYLITKAAASLTWCVLSWIPAVVLMIPVALLTPVLQPHIGMILGGSIVLIGAWLCLHLYFFGLTLLACCFCGTGVMGGCMLLMLAGYVPFLALSLIGFAELSFSMIATDYYMSEKFFSSISGVFRIFSNIASGKTVWFLLGCALVGLLFCAAGILLCVIRKSEKAGTPFAFDRVRDIVKYLLMGLSSLLGGMLFTVMSTGGWAFFWMLFGCACGAVLCWMLCNTIFYKTPKQMFVGRRGLAILTAVMMLWSAGVRLDIIGLDRYIPSNVMTNTVEMRFDSGMNLSFNDKSLVRIYNAMMKNGRVAFQQYGNISLYRTPIDKETYLSSGVDMVNYGTSVWKTNYLIPIAADAYVLYPDWVQFVQALTAKENFADLFFADAMDTVRQSARRYPEETLYVRYYSDSGVYAESEKYEISANLRAEEVLSILELYREEMRAKGADALQQTYTGTLRIRTADGYYYIPVYACYSGVIRQLAALAKENGMDNDVLTIQYEKTFESAQVYHRGSVIAVLNEEEFVQLQESGVLNRFNDTYNSPMTLNDLDYGISVSYQITETMYNDYEYTYAYTPGEVSVEAVDSNNAKPVAETTTNTYTSEFSVGFFYGCVPERFIQMTEG